MSTESSPRHALALLGSLALSGCAQTAVSTPAEAPPMSAPVAASTATPDARSLLQSLLDLIVATPRVQDVTPDRLGAAMHQTVQSWGPSHYGFGGTLTGEWRYALEVDQASMHGPRLDFSFVPATAGTTPVATDICAYDFDAVAALLTASGFRHETRRGEHDRVIDDRFLRDGQTVTVLTRGESDVADKATHRCVVSVILS